MRLRNEMSNLQTSASDSCRAANNLQTLLGNERSQHYNFKKEHEEFRSFFQQEKQRAYTFKKRTFGLFALWLLWKIHHIFPTKFNVALVLGAGYVYSRF
jgi:hypothetical protein